MNYSFENIKSNYPLIDKLLKELNLFIDSSLDKITVEQEYSMIKKIHECIDSKLFPEIKDYSILNNQHSLTFKIKDIDKKRVNIYSFDIQFVESNVKQLECKSLILFKVLKKYNSIATYGFSSVYYACGLRSLKYPSLGHEGQIVFLPQSDQFHFTGINKNITLNETLVNHLYYLELLGRTNYDLLKELLFNVDTMTPEKKDFFKLMYDMDIESSPFSIDINKLKYEIKKRPFYHFFNL